jgi:hypothetical protein
MPGIGKHSQIIRIKTTLRKTGDFFLIKWMIIRLIMKFINNGDSLKWVLHLFCLYNSGNEYMPECPLENVLDEMSPDFGPKGEKADSMIP